MVRPRVFPHNKQILKRIKNTVKPLETESYVVNRNPRNLEFLRIAPKPKGYHLDAKFSKECNYWHKLVVTPSAKFVTAQLIHYQNGAVIEASTQEWAVKKQLYKTSDLSAYTNLAKVFAQRCLESGIYEMTTKPYSGAKIETFMEVLKQNGLCLEEPPEIKVNTDPNFNRYQGRIMKPIGWEDIVEHH